jgi:hypothetical protein
MRVLLGVTYRLGLNMIVINQVDRDTAVRVNYYLSILVTCEVHRYLWEPFPRRIDLLAL